MEKQVGGWRNRLGAFLYAVVQFALLCAVLWLIWAGVLTIPTNNGGTDSSIGGGGAGAGAAVAFIGALFSIIWVVVWYAAVGISIAKAKQTGDAILSLSGRIALVLPPAFVAAILLWYCGLWRIYNSYLYLKYDRLDTELRRYIINEKPENTFQFIEAQSEEFWQHELGKQILPVAANQPVIFDCIFNHLANHRFNTLPMYSNKNGDCVFCGLNDENSALNVLSKLNFETSNIDALNSYAFCGNEDLLIFFIRKKWYRCMQSYLEKAGVYNARALNPANSQSNQKSQTTPYKYYHCQIRVNDTTTFSDSTTKKQVINPYFKFTAVNPADYTQDNTALAILCNYSFTIKRME